MTPASGISPLTVHFENHSKFGVGYIWYLPSGSLYVEVPDPITFTEPGSYHIRLRVYGEPVNSSNDFSQTVTVYDPPNADFEVSATTGVAGVTAFTFSKSLTDGISGWAWDFGDGGTSGEAQPVHIYQSPGSYTVSLTISGDWGSSTKTRTVTVYDPPNADFEVSATTGVAGVTAFTFSKSLTDGISGWAWDFGDGGTSGEAQPVHIYQSPGSYTVSLTISGDWGSSTKAVTVIGLVGDFNEDGRVGFADFFQFADHFGLVEGAPSTEGRVWDATFDLNRDGGVGFDDFFIFADHFGEDSAAGKRSATWAMLAHEQLKPRLELAEIHRDKAVIALRLTADRPIRGIGVILSHAPDLIMSSASGKLTGSDVGRERLETVFRSPHPDQTVAASFYLHKAVPSNVEDQVLELSFDLSSDVMGTDVFLQSLQVIAADGSLYRADLANVHVTLVPQEYSLSEPFPNPFNPAVQIDYALPHAGEVEIVVYNILGQKVRTLLSDWQEAGFQRIAWHGLDDANRQMASGVYLIRVTTSGLLRTRKVMLIR